jgi:hypothetical protein
MSDTKVQMSEVGLFLLVSLSVAGLCLSALLLSFPLHRQVGQVLYGMYT